MRGSPAAPARFWRRWSRRSQAAIRKQRALLLAVRLIGLGAGGAAGWQLGLALAGFPSGTEAAGEALRYVLVLAVAGAALGLLVMPHVTVAPLRRLWGLARGADARYLSGASLGLLVGLLAAALAAFPVSLLPDPFGRWLPAALAVLLAWLGLTIGALRKDEVLRALGLPRRPSGGDATGDDAGKAWGTQGGGVLLDTSAVIDGRIVAIRVSGFLSGDLTVPHFVLEELQHLADSADPARRQRGRRGLEALERLKREAELAVLDVDYPDVRGVDSKLIRLARQRRAAIVTTDSNLQRVAGLQGIAVLNVNDLGNALRAVVVTGEDLTLEIVQPGRERGQGIGFLEDGTMVIVEGGRRYLGGQAEVEVTRVLPTAGGRIVFSRLKQPLPDAEGLEDPPAGIPALRVVPDRRPDRHEGAAREVRLEPEVQAGTRPGANGEAEGRSGSQTGWAGRAPADDGV